MNTLQCTCGKKFRSYVAEARHRHNFPSLCLPPLRKYVFKVGVFEPRRQVTVRARDVDTAKMRARRVMDLRFERKDREPPVSWDLELVNTSKIEV